MKKYQFIFECIKEGSVYGQGGSECHGLLFSLLRDTHANYARTIHAADFNPYSLGQLRGEGRKEKGIFYLHPDTQYSFTVSTLSNEMGEVIRSLHPLIHPAHQFRLGSADCRWLRLETEAESQYEQLLKMNIHQRFSVEFISPTCFRHQGVSLLYPTPELVFTNLLERWNVFAAVNLNVELNNMLFISRYDLKTSLVQFSKYRMTGFTGRVEYSFSKTASNDTRQSIEALARFADFAGIGYKTGMGMGESKFSN